MSDLMFLIVNASVVCFIASYCFLKVFRSKVLLICLIISPFVLTPALQGVVKQWVFGYLFVLQYGGLGVACGVLLFEIDQIKRAKKLRYFTSFLAKVTMILPCFYLFVYVTKQFVAKSQSVETGVEYASMFGLVSGDDIAIVEYLGSYINFTGMMIALFIIMVCSGVLVLNKYRAFREVQRI